MVLEDLPASKKEAIAVGSRHFYTGKPCRNGHLSYRIVTHPKKSECSECRRVAGRKGTANYVAKNRETVLGYAREYQARKRASGEDWASRNREVHAEMKNSWKRENLDRVRATAMKRKAALLNAQPWWLTKEQEEEMVAIYREAVRLTKETGVRYEVDHIIPLQGRTVCGLHVPWNLRVITAEENNRRPRIWKEDWS